MSAALTERLVYVARAARDAGHGKRGAIYDAACAELGISRATLLRKLKEVSVTDKRKTRRCRAQCPEPRRSRADICHAARGHP